MRVHANSPQLPSGTVSVLLVKARNNVEKRAVEWVDGLQKTDSDGVGNEDLCAKPGGDKVVVKRGAPQLDVQKLELEQQSASRELVKETQEAL